MQALHLFSVVSMNVITTSSGSREEDKLEKKKPAAAVAAAVVAVLVAAEAAVVVAAAAVVVVVVVVVCLSASLSLTMLLRVPDSLMKFSATFYNKHWGDILLSYRLFVDVQILCSRLNQNRNNERRNSAFKSSCTMSFSSINLHIPQ